MIISSAKLQHFIGNITGRVILLALCTLPLPGIVCAAPDDFSKIFPAIDLLLQDSGACNTSVDDSSYKYDLVYRGLHYFAPELPSKKYSLPQLTDRQFNNLSKNEKLIVADKLLSSLFFGYKHDELKALIESGSFLCSIKTKLTESINPIQQIEEYILDDDYFYHAEYSENEVHDILARLYVMKHLDRYFLHNWVAYILTQTIMFSPGYELDSAHLPDVANVYNWLVLDMEDDVSMRYSSYMHMASLENWRRFRSPEDNGREMLEIFLGDFNDENVPKAATALQNWYLDEDHDTLVIGLNGNTVPISLFNTRIINGFDFYRELVKTDDFILGVTKRLVNFFFTQSTQETKNFVVDRIVRSKPRRWEDILVQMVFSKEYLLKSDREKSAEELFFSFAKKMPFKHRRKTFYYLNNSLEEMNQASMKYKLGKLQRTPLDSLSFANYHKFVRESMVYKSECGEDLTTYDGYGIGGWTPEMTDEKYFSLIQDNPEATMISFIQYLFTHFIQRQATKAELDMFLDEMLYDNRTRFSWSNNLWNQDSEGCFYGRKYTAKEVLDYLSRLTDFYWFEGVQK